MSKKKEYVPFWKGFREELSSLKELRIIKYPFIWMREASSLSWIIFVIVLTCGQPLFDMAWPYFIKSGADNLTGHATYFGWQWSFILAGLSLVIGSTLFDMATYWARVITYTAEKLLKSKLYFHLMFASLGIHDTFRIGNLITTLTKAPYEVRNFLYSKGFTDTFPLLIRNVFICINFAIIDFWLFAMTVPFMIIVLLIYVFGARAINRNEYQIWQADKQLTAGLTEAIPNMSIIKTFRKEQYEFDSLEKANILQLEQNARQARNWRILGRITSVFQLGLWIGASLYIGSKIYAGQLGIGTIFQISALFVLFVKSFFQTAIMYSTMRAVAIRLKDVLKVLNSEPEDLNAPNKTVLSAIRQNITMRDLEFAYDVSKEEGGKKAVLRGINCEIPIGKTTLLAGENASGKTTLFKILLGFYQYQNGQVLFDGIPSTAMTLDSIRSQFSMVDQGAWLKSGSIKDNIAYGSKNEVSDGEIIEAAKVAGVHDYIISLPLGYDTDVGEWSKKVSGGTRQRIAIARALMSKAPIIFFDEPLSSIDAPKRVKVWRDIRELLKGKTIIVISHIPLEVDNVIVIDQGRVIGTGTDEELWHSLPAYKDLYPDRLAA